MHLTGVTENHALQKTYMLSDLATCITNTDFLYLVHKHTHQFRCIQGYLLRCLLINIPNNLTVDSQYGFSYCGAFSVSEKNHFATEVTVFIKINNGHILQVEVLHFNFKISRTIFCADHGFIFVYKLHRSGYYCGRRLPWMVIIPTEEAYLHMTLVGGVEYKLNIFYSSFQHSWIRQLISVKQMHIENNRIISTGVESDINSFQYYILTNYINRMELHVYSTCVENCYLSLHDGPGALSRIIFQLNTTDTPGGSMVRTSAYWAFLDILFPDHYVTDRPINITISIRLAPNLKIIQNTFLRGVYSYTSDNMENTVCSDYFETPAPDETIFLHVNKFIYSGPNTLSDIPSQQCQYGGLFVRFDLTEKWFEFCDDISDLNIHSSHDGIYVALFWFSGYSQGSIIADFQKDACGIIYLELNHELQIHKENIITKVNQSLGCHYIVCPPLQKDIQRLCTIQLGPPSVGTTQIEVILYDTLDPCDQRFVNVPSEQKLTYELKVKYSSNWPFDIHNSTTQQTLYDFSSGNVHKYQYLESGNITSTLFCTNDSPRAQVTYFVVSSLCDIRKHALKKAMVINIPAFSDKCLMLGYTFIATKEHLFVNNRDFRNHFIYKDTGHINTGHFVSMNYDNCPIECQNYKYSVFVRHIDDRTIIEHTAHVGHVIFTGFYHKGFRISIFLPAKICLKHLKCILTVYISKTTVRIGQHNYNDYATKVKKLGKFILYNTR